MSRNSNVILWASSIIIASLHSTTGAPNGTSGSTGHTQSHQTSPTQKPVNTTRGPTTPNPNANKTVCYHYVGCFDNFHPFDNAMLDLPLSPEQCGTQFMLFTRQTPNTTEQLDYKDPTPVQNSHFDPTKLTKIIVHGFNNGNSTPWLYEMKDDFLFNGDYNVIIVAWGPCAKFPNYDQAVSNTRLVGTQIRLVVDTLLKTGAKLKDIHLVGHSLGAHTCGYAGRLLHGQVGRITGLDPAEPDFEHLDSRVRVDPSDAQFVDIIHTNGASILSGGAGLMQVSGHVDFFVNGGEFQAGCDDLGGTLSGILHLQFSGIPDKVACSHMRSHQYFQESLRRQSCPFTAYPCSDYDKFQRGECLSCGTTGCSQLGYYADQYHARGKLYLKTRGTAPFCGFQYGYSLRTHNITTKGQISIQMRGEYGDTNWLDITEEDDNVPASQTLKGVIVSTVEVGDVKSVQIKYKKKTSGFFFWHTGEDEWMAHSLNVESGESGQSFFFCLKDHVLHDKSAISFPSTSNVTKAAC